MHVAVATLLKYRERDVTAKTLFVPPRIIFIIFQADKNLEVYFRLLFRGDSIRAGGIQMSAFPPFGFQFHSRRVIIAEFIFT